MIDDDDDDVYMYGHRPYRYLASMSYLHLEYIIFTQLSKLFSWDEVVKMYRDRCACR